jgi:cytochrome c
MLKLKYCMMFLALSAIIASCGGGQSKIDEIKSQTIKPPSDPMANWESNNGIGPISAFTLPTEIDQQLVAEGLLLYEIKCTACHKIDKKFIGPSPNDSKRPYCKAAFDRSQ